MRIWDQVPPENLCRQHLLAQWREGLGLWNILTQGKRGYANHPETKRWVDHDLALLVLLHDTRKAMLARSWNPKPLPNHMQTGVGVHLAYHMPTRFGKSLRSQRPAPWDDQLATLRAKGCDCRC